MSFPVAMQHDSVQPLHELVCESPIVGRHLYYRSMWWSLEFSIGHCTSCSSFSLNRFTGELHWSLEVQWGSIAPMLRLVMAAAALRVSCATTTTALQRACISSSYHSSALHLVSAPISQFIENSESRAGHVYYCPLGTCSVVVWSKGNCKEHHHLLQCLFTPQVGRKSVAWRVTELCRVHTLDKTRLFQSSGLMSSSDAPRCFSDGKWMVKPCMQLGTFVLSLLLSSWLPLFFICPLLNLGSPSLSSLTPVKRSLRSSV